MIFDDLELDPSLGLVGFTLCGRFTVLAVEDWQRLNALGVRWTTTVNRGRQLPVVVHPARGRTIAGRAIAGATEAQTVGYRDGNPFLLLRSNLVVADTRARRCRLPKPLTV